MTADWWQTRMKSSSRRTDRGLHHWRGRSHQLVPVPRGVAPGVLASPLRHQVSRLMGGDGRFGFTNKLFSVSKAYKYGVELIDEVHK